MIETIIGALLPIIVTLMLGLLAGWHKDFSADQATVLNRMVMLYALPLSLFSGMIQVSLQELLSDGYLLILVTAGMLGGFLISFLLSWKVFKRDRGTAALQTLAISGPAVPFVGVPVLGFLFGVQSAVAVAMGSILLNMIQVPICIIILTLASPAPVPNKGDSAKTEKGRADSGIGRHVLAALKEPVVWAPFVALILILIGLKPPRPVIDSLNLLGKATGGVGLFASGIILFTQHVKVNRPVLVSVFSRNIIVPLAVFLLAMLMGTPHPQKAESVLALAIPTASITVMLAVQYKTAEREMASTLFLSTALSVLTMGGFIWLTR